MTQGRCSSTMSVTSSPVSPSLLLTFHQLGTTAAWTAVTATMSMAWKATWVRLSPNASSVKQLIPPNLVEIVERLKFFLATAPSIFATPPPDLVPPSHAHALTPGVVSHGTTSTAPAFASMSASISTMTEGASLQTDEDQQRFRRFLLPNGEYISCVLWNGLYHITGTDIIRTLVFRFRTFGRRISNMKKFEEGVFSDLRNLKAGIDATLELPKVGGTWTLAVLPSTHPQPRFCRTHLLTTKAEILYSPLSLHAYLLLRYAVMHPTAPHSMWTLNAAQFRHRRHTSTFSRRHGTEHTSIGCLTRNVLRVILHVYTTSQSLR